MQALEPTTSCPGSGVHFMQVATYSSAWNSFQSAAAQFPNLNVGDPATFAQNAAADGINAGTSSSFLKIEQTFANCLKTQ